MFEEKVFGADHRCILVCIVDTLVVVANVEGILLCWREYPVCSGAFVDANIGSLMNLFSDVATQLFEYVNPRTGRHSPMVSESFHDIVMRNADVSFSFNVKKFLHSSFA